MKFPRFKPREMRLLALTLAVAFGLLNYLSVLPWCGRIAERNLGLKKSRSEQEYRREALRHVAAWREELARLNAENDPSSHIGSQEMWMKHFEELAGKSGVELIQRRSVKPEGKAQSDLLRVECSLQGSFETVINFLWSLSSDGSRPRVEACQLSPIKAGEDKLRGQLTLVVALKGAVRK